MITSILLLRIYVSVETRATRLYRTPRPGALGYRKSSTKIAFSGRPCVFSAPPELSAIVTHPPARSGFRRKYVYYLSAAEKYTYLRRNMRYLQNSWYSQIRKPKHTTEPGWNSILSSFWPVRGLEISDSVRRKSTFPTPPKSRVSTSDWNRLKLPEIQK